MVYRRLSKEDLVEVVASVQTPNLFRKSVQKEYKRLLVEKEKVEKEIRKIIEPKQPKMRKLVFRIWGPRKQGDLVMYSPASLQNMCEGDWPGRDIQGMTFMQFTGLFDRNGKDIYEGDIVRRFEKHAPEETPLIMFVEWGTASCGWVLIDEQHTMYLSNLCILEVVGNIYQNPELLKSNEKRRS